MEPLLQLHTVINKICPLTGEEWEEFAAIFKPDRFEKGINLTAEGQVENYVYFITNGLCRMCFVDSGKEFTIDFWFENDFISSYLSFLTREPSIFQIQAIEAVEVLKASYSDINRLYDKSQNIERIGRRLTEYIYIRKTKREIELLSLTAQQRYANLLEKAPDLARKISVKHLSSYLGIHPESLSRIRAKK